MEAIPSGFKSPLSHRIRVILISTVAATAGVVGCAPEPAEVAAEVRAALERGSKEPDPAFLDALTVGSRKVVERLVEAGGYAQLRDRLLASLKAVRPGQADGVVVGADGAALFFVRDGHGRRLDLALSDPLFFSLREQRYPVPW